MRKLMLYIPIVLALLLSTSCGYTGAQSAKENDMVVVPKPSESEKPTDTSEPTEPVEPTVPVEFTVPEEFKDDILIDTVLCDIDGDGKQDIIYVYENDDECFFAINDSIEKHNIFDVWELTQYESTRVLKYKNQEKCLLFTYSEYSTYTSIWYLKGLEPIKVFNSDGYFVDYEDDIVTISRFRDSIGSWYVEYKYLLGEEGVNLLDIPLALNHVHYDTVTTKIDIEAYYFDGESYAIEGIIKAEEVITFTHILFESTYEYIYFELEDGAKGRFLVEHDEAEDYNITVNGKSIEDCFVDIESYFNDTYL